MEEYASSKFYSCSKIDTNTEQECVTTIEYYYINFIPLDSKPDGTSNEIFSRPSVPSVQRTTIKISCQNYFGMYKKASLPRW